MSEEGKTSNDFPVFSAEDLGFTDVPNLDDEDNKGDDVGEMKIVSASELDPDLEGEGGDGDDPGDDSEDIADDSDGGESYAEDADDQAIGLYKTLLEKGTIVEDEENPFDGTWDSLDEYLAKIPYFERSRIYSNAPEPLQKLLEFAFADERSVTKEALKEFITAYLEDTEEKTAQTFESTEDARSYLRKYFIEEKELDELMADAALDVLEEKGEDGSELVAKANAIEKAKLESKSTKHEQLLAEKKKEAEKLEQSQNQFASQVVEALEETKWDKSRITTIKRQLANNQTQTTYTKAWNSPKALIQLANLATFYDEKTGEFDLTTFVKQVASKSIKDLKNKQLKDNFTSKGSNAKGGANKKSRSSAIDNLEAVIP